MTRPTHVLALALLCVFITTGGQVALKIGVSSPALSALSGAGRPLQFLLLAFTSPAVIVGLVLYAASAVLWLIVLSRAELSYAFPLVSLGFVTSAAYAHWFLREPLGPARLAGILLIVIGVIFVSRS